jgi:hypothetical protein
MNLLCTLDVYVDLSLNIEDKVMGGFVASKMKCSANIIASLFEAKFFNLCSNFVKKYAILSLICPSVRTPSNKQAPMAPRLLVEKHLTDRRLDDGQ